MPLLSLEFVYQQGHGPTPRFKLTATGSQDCKRRHMSDRDCRHSLTSRTIKPANRYDSSKLLSTINDDCADVE